MGEAARRQTVTNPDRTISSVKRHMGTEWTTRIDGKLYRPQTISAMILMQLKKEAAEEAADAFRREMSALGFTDEEMIEFFRKRCGKVGFMEERIG